MTLIVIAGVAQVALAQQRAGAPEEATAMCAPDAGSAASPCAPTATASDAGAPGASYTDGGAEEAAPEPPVSRAGERDACSEVLRAVQFEDLPAATTAYARCRGRFGHSGHIPVADDIRAIEDATEALHGLRRDDGAFCVEPSAPFDFTALTAGATDTRACLAALDRFLASDNAVWRFVLADAYASGRLASRAGYDIVSARRNRRRPLPGTPAERELVAIARLAGRHFMRTCRCLEGPQPDSITSVRAMHLPSTVESVILRALEEREEAHGEP